MSLAVDTLAILTRCAAEALSSEQETLDALRTNDVVVLSDNGNLTISAQIIEEGSVLFIPIPFAIAIPQIPAILTSFILDKAPLETDARGVFVYPVTPGETLSATQYDEVIEAQQSQGQWFDWRDSKFGRLFCSTDTSAGETASPTGEVSNSGDAASEVSNVGDAASEVSNAGGAASNGAQQNQTSPDSSAAEPLSAFIAALSSSEAAAPQQSMSSIMDAMSKIIADADLNPQFDPADLVRTSNDHEKELQTMLENINIDDIKLPDSIGEVLSSLLPKP